MTDDTLDNGWKRFLARLKDLWTEPPVLAPATMTLPTVAASKAAPLDDDRISQR